MKEGRNEKMQFNCFQCAHFRDWDRHVNYMYHFFICKFCFETNKLKMKPEFKSVIKLRHVWRMDQAWMRKLKFYDVELLP